MSIALYPSSPPKIPGPLFYARLALSLALIVLAAAAQAQAGAPVILVHGLKSNDATWQRSVAHLESLGFGTPYSYHFDLNASSSTRAEDDVVGPAVAPFWDFVTPTPARTGSEVPDSLALPFDPEGPRPQVAPRGAGATPFVLVNFETWYDGASNTIWVHGTRGLAGHSESNCSAVAKQGYALGLVVADVLAWTGADSVILLGHSMGGLAIREYLQRRLPNGTPRWWADPSAAGGHGVAAAVTYGTPHQGSNTVNLGLFGCPDSEATRDLRYSYVSTGETAPYLYGGDEDIAAYWHNDDVNADGVEGGPVVGLNTGDPSGIYSRDNPAIPLPTDVAYTYIYSTTDWIVPAPRQLVQFLGADGNPYVSPYGSSRAVRRDVGHTAQTDDAEMIAWAVQNARWFPTPSDALPGATVPPVATVYPNPVRGEATVEVLLYGPSSVAVDVVDALGRVVLHRDLGHRGPGGYRVPLAVGRLAPGTYLLRSVVDGVPATPRPFTVVR